MIHIIEGPDGCGKSEFARKLANIWKTELIHMGRPSKDFDFYKEYKNLILDKDNVVFDRFFYSQLVYGPIKRSNSVLTRDQICELECLMKEKGAIIYYLSADINELIGRCNKRGEDYIKIDEFAKIVYSYKEVMNETAIPVIRIDTTETFPIR